jgi:transposase
MLVHLAFPHLAPDPRTHQAESTSARRVRGHGPIEGANTKVELLKRRMYGRAGFPLLRQRILLS